jgi:glyoxylase-like metal-dependent hydrolase (beta-lactamase superfamily II)
MAHMREIADGVLQIPFGFVNAYVVVTDDGLVLVDTGLPRRQATIERALAEAQRSVGDIRTILLTHWHTDHAGTVGSLRAASGARIVAHALDAGVISGQEPEPRTLLMRLASPFVGVAQKVPLDEVLSSDGEFSVPDVTAVHTPGHTPGHVSFLVERGGGVLVAGDAVGSIRGRLRGSPRPLTADPSAAAKSVAKLASLRFEIAVFGHGSPLTERALERFRALAGS